MPEYKAPLREIKFVSDEVLAMPEHYASLPTFADVATPDMVDAILT
ncbi:MAG: acyl-CoA dehydrogenase N-terminal domain-containing protein, partial [Bermanella sp.]